MSSESGVPERAEVETEYKWDLESVYESDGEWEQAFEDVQERLGELEEYEGAVVSDGETLLELLRLRDDLMREVSKVAAYARMRSDEDTRDQEYQAMSARASALVSEASAAASFVEPELQTLEREEMEGLVESTAGLEEYEHYLDDVLRMKPHTRSAEIEELLSELGEVMGAPGDIYGKLTNADVTFPTVEKPDGSEVEITQSNFTKLLKNGDRDFRRTVHEAFFEELEGVRNTIGTSLQYSVKGDVKSANARFYDTAREAALDGPNVPEEVYDNLVDTVDENLDVLHRHARLKREALGVDTLRPWDIYMPLAESESPDLDYDRAADYVVEAMAPLGDGYQERVSDGLDSRWVDVYENRGKRAGAYSGGTYDTQPYILMNYQDDIPSLYTLAHELGHSLHSQLTSEEQPYVYSSYEIFVAEVASTVNEALLTHHLLDVVDDEEFRLHVLNEYLERFRSTLFRQTLFADFEHRIHTMEEEGQPLTPDVLDEAYGDLKARYYEPMELDDHIAREWMRIPHFYYNYYVYQYATGISAAVAIVDRILEEGEPAANDYLEFLSAGSTQYPLDLLDIAGVDMRAPDPVRAAIDAYDDHLDTVAGLI